MSGSTASGRVLEAVVVEQLPSDLYRLALADRSTVLAHVSDRRQNDFLRLLPGDKVEVRLSPQDRRRGRIIRRVQA
ncbi:MAG: translation initiation factor IF-1 [Acidobacteria bacterium]|nr:translation initiation factor IF-1 [Acidobacteriota bacterium]